MKATDPQQSIGPDGIRKLRVQLVRMMNDAIASGDVDASAGAAWGVRRKGLSR
jgi:hypothetical protein